MDRKIIRSAIKGKKEAFGIMINTLKLDGYRLAYYYLGNEADSQDALCNAIEKAYKNIHRLKEADKYKQWFLSIVANEAKQLLRKQSKEDLIELDQYRSKNHIQVDEMTMTEKRLDLEKAMDQLPKEHVTMIKLKYYEGYTFKEIGSIISKPENTVKTTIYRALEQLAKKMGKEDQHERQGV